MSVTNEKFISCTSSWVHDVDYPITQEYRFASTITSFPDHISGITTTHKSDLVVASLNVNTLSVSKLGYVLDRMFLHSIDVVCLQDTRHLGSSTSHYKLALSNYLKEYAPKDEGQGGVLLSYPVNIARAPGGHMIICRAKWGRRLSAWSPDTSSLGLSMWADFSLSGKSFRILSTYWPTYSEDKHPGSLFNRIKSYASTHSISGSPTQISQHILGKAILPFSNPNKSYILCGDFNASWSLKKADSQLSSWGSSLGLSHFLVQSRPLTSPTPHSFVARRKEGEFPSHIDHILHRTGGFTQPTFSVILSGGDHISNTDHSLLIQGFTVGSSYTPLEAAIQHVLPPDINLKDKKLLESLAQFQLDLLHTLPLISTLTPEAASNQLLSLQTEIVSHIRRLRPTHSRFRSKYKNNWSPIYSATAKHLAFLIEVRRHCQGHKKRFRWTNDRNVKDGISQLRTKWVKSSIPLTEDDQLYVDSLTPRPQSFWITQSSLSLSRVTKYAETDIKSLKSAMHNRTRVKLRTSVSGTIKHNTAIKEINSIKASIQNLLGSSQQPTSLHVVNDNGKLIHSPLDIHTTITSTFHSHFATPEGLSSGIHTTQDWSTILTDEEAFFAHSRSQGVPLTLITLIWRSMRIHLSPSHSPKMDRAKLELQRALANPPTLIQFQQSIKRASKGSSPGVSGFSYSILSVLSPAIVTYIYDLLVVMWPSKYQPEWWKWRWLSVIPKTANPDLTQFRPIMLLEATRKLWTGLVAKTISTIWEKHSILHPAQFGARPKLSTYTNLLQTITCLEASRMLKQDLYIGCWDLKKAFDCPSKPVLKMAWNRLGVPSAIADWLVSIDEAGPTIVRTPAAVKQWNSKGYDGFNEYSPTETPTHPTYFKAQRGTGQGDNPSPSNYISVADILLHALDLGSREPPLQGPNSTHPLCDTFYVDDQTSLCSSLGSLQRKADIISAFNIIFGFEFNLQKSDVFLQTYSPSPNQTVIVHSSGWVPHPLTISTSGSFKSLGVFFDLDGSGSTQHSKALAHINTVTQVLSLKRAPSAIKLLVTRLVPMNQLMYYGAMSPWTLSQYKELDKPISLMFRRITNNLDSFPEALLYLNKSLGGLQLPHLSQIMQQRKWSAITSALSSSPTNLSLQFLLTLLISKAISPPLPDQMIRIPPLTFPSIFTSLTEWLSPDGGMVRGGVDFGESSLIPISILTDDPLTLRHCARQGLASLVDLFSDRRPNSARVSTSIPKTLNQHTETALVLGLAQAPRAGQLWYNSHSAIYIHASSQSSTTYQPYTISPPSTGQYLLHFPPIPTQSNPTRSTNDLNSVFEPNDHWKQIYYSLNTHIISKIVPSPPPTTPTHTTNFDHFMQLLTPHILPNYIICTDGSWRQTGSLSDQLFHFSSHLTTHVGAAIVLLHNSSLWHQHPVYSVNIAELSNYNLPSVFPAEALALFVAIQLSLTQDPPLPIFSDSLSSISHIKKFNPRKPTKDSLQFLFTGIHKLLSGPIKPTITHVKAHPEQTMPNRSQWTTPNWGNYLADHLCSDKWDNVICPSTPTFDHVDFTVRAHTLITQLGLSNHLFFTNRFRQQCLLTTPSQSLQQSYLEDYTSTREKVSNILGRRNIWSPEEISIEFAADIAQPFWKHVSLHAKALRIQWNKGYYGDTRSKFNHPPDTSPREIHILSQCEYCHAHFCDQQHWIVDCTFPAFALLRRSILDTCRARLTQIHRHDQLHVMVPLLEQILIKACQPEGFRLWIGMLTRLQASSFLPHIPRVSSQLLSTITKHLHSFFSILLQGSVDMWLLRWDTPYTSDFTRLIESPYLHNLFKYKLPKLRIPKRFVPKSDPSSLLRLANSQAKAKRSTQRRLGKLITTQPKLTITDISTSYKAQPTYLQDRTVTPALRGQSKSQKTSEYLRSYNKLSWPKISNSLSPQLLPTSPHVYGPQNPISTLPSQSSTPYQVFEPALTSTLTEDWNLSPQIDPVNPSTDPTVSDFDTHVIPTHHHVCPYSTMQRVSTKKISKKRKGDG